MMMNSVNFSTISTISPPVPNTTRPYGPIIPSNDKCNYYIVNQTSIAWLDFGNPYGGIPQNLLINSVSLSLYWGGLTMLVLRSGSWCCSYSSPYSVALLATTGDWLWSGRMTTSLVGPRYSTHKDKLTRTKMRRRKRQHSMVRVLSFFLSPRVIT